MNSDSSAERYSRAKEIFFRALEIEAAKQIEFVRAECGEDIELRGEVESLLTVRDDARDFFRLPEFTTASGYESLKKEIFGGYRLIGELGAGGMGAVFLAEKGDTEFQRRVAIKLIKNNLHSKALLKRFDLERHILNGLEHPNIARLLDGGTSQNGSPYFVMEYVEGLPLIEYADSNDLDITQRIELFRQVCAAVSYAHKHAVIHRDLKPSNILVTSDGEAKLLDFGIAKLLSPKNLSPVTTTTFRAMTPEFSSPEQIKGESVTTASDVYSLGIILYELLTGFRPYKINTENLNEIIHAVCETHPERPSSVGPGIRSLRGDLDNIVLKALRKEPDRRYSSVDSLSDDLRKHLAGLPVSARPDTFAYRTEKFIKRNRLAAALAALGVLVLIGGIVATIWQARRAEEQRSRAERRFNDVRTLANSFMFELNDEILKGQTQGRELVVKRAIEYLDLLAGEAVDDVLLRQELAVAYLKIGDIQGKPYSPNLGDTDGAIRNYQKARTILEALHNDGFTNPEIQRNLGTAYLNIGSVQGIRTNDSDAVENLRKSLALCELLIGGDPANLEHRRMLADIYKALGDALEDSDERLEAHRKALALREELLVADPTNTRELTAIASIHQRIGTRLDANLTDNADEYRAALEHFDKSLSIYKKLREIEPNNTRHRRNVADMTAMRMLIQARLGDKPGVIASYSSAMETFRELAASDQRNAEARLDIALTHHLMCRSLLKLNETAGGIKNCRQGLRIFESLLAIDPTNDEARLYISNSYALIAKTAGNGSSSKNPTP